MQRNSRDDEDERQHRQEDATPWRCASSRARGYDEGLAVMSLSATRTGETDHFWVNTHAAALFESE